MWMKLWALLLPMSWRKRKKVETPLQYRRCTILRKRLRTELMSAEVQEQLHRALRILEERPGDRHEH